MAGRGPAPATQHQRTRDTARRQAGGAALVSDGRVRGSKLKGEFLPQTLEWHEAWRRSPMAQTFLPTDWQRLAMLATLVDRYYTHGKALDLAEIRLNEAALGGSPLDRLRLKWTVVAPEAAEHAPAGVASLADQRRKTTADRLKP